MYIHNKKYDYIVDMQVDTLPSGRTYHTPDGSYPSLTTLLGKTSPNQQWLQRWKERVGEEEASRVSREATERGTLVHSIAENHFNNLDTFDLLDGASADVIQMSKDLIQAVSSGISEIWGQEQILWSNKYCFAGRTDMVGLWKGTPTIIDFKTSKKPKAVTQIRDYFLQCCGYAVAHNEMYRTGIKHCVIVITIDGKPPQLFEQSVVPFLPELKARVKQFALQNN